jgi:hypothetical protein
MTHLTLRPVFIPIASSQTERSEWPDDGLGLGSYPKLPDISAQTKAPHGWWDIQERRNFGDTVRMTFITCYISDQQTLSNSFTMYTIMYLFLCF